MANTITIEPVTRIEGHAKITIHLDDAGNVEQARFHVNEFRGFEKFCEGRMFYEMPLITERICGICPVSHHLASAKAGDEILGVEPPQPARLLRELMHMGQTIQSHSMHFFELAGPDLILGFDADPAIRNVVGLYQADPKLTVKAITLRKFGQEIIAKLGERRVHPNFAVPGGVTKALAAADRDAMLSQVEPMIALAQDGIAVMKTWMEKHAEEMEKFAAFPTGYLGMVTDDNAVALYDSALRMVDAQRRLIERFDGRQYLDCIAEHVENWSYLKFPYYRKLGWPGGAYRVGPLGRLNAAEKMSTPLAQKEFDLFHRLGKGKVVEGSLYYHYARLIENLYAICSKTPTSSPPRSGPTLGPPTAKASALSRHRAVRSGIIIGSTKPVGSKRSTSSLPPATTTTP
jgi:NAD-reducing hydrogenase large subunit